MADRTLIEPKRAAVDPRTFRFAILALALGGFGIGTTEFVSMGLLPNIADQFTVSEPTAGHIIAAYAIGVVVGAPVLAAATAKVPRRTLLIWLMVAFAVGNTLTLLAPTYETLIAARFISGLPHGAYFGVAGLVAANMAPAGKQGKAIGQVMMGLSVANVVGVPAAAWLGDALGWRSAYAVVVVIALATAAAVLIVVPHSSIRATNPLTELGALRRPQVWLTLGVGIVGFGGMFAVYTYLATTMTDVAGISKGLVPIGLMLFGVGMVIGTLLGGINADKSINGAITFSLVFVAVVMVIFSFAARSPWTVFPAIFLVGVSGSSLVPALQLRLMAVSQDAQTLAAALNHSALNIANAAGALAGGTVITMTDSYTAPALLGAVLAVAGLLVFSAAVMHARRGTANEPELVPT